MRPSSLVIVVGISIAACSDSTDSASGDVGDTQGEAVVTTGCDRDAVLAGANGDRRAAIERGFTWVDQDVPYSQAATHDGYRTDCSGFVSMAWETTAPGDNTSGYSSGRGVADLTGMSDLLPADALVTRGKGHMMLFVGWANASHSTACVIEEVDKAEGIKFRGHPASSLEARYKPIRADKFASDTNAGGSSTSPTDPSGNDPGANDPNGNGPDPNGNGPDPNGNGPDPNGNGPDPGSNGPPPKPGGCNRDDDCGQPNRVCVMHVCVPGCHSSAQCAGGLSCIHGMCQ